MTFVEHRIVIVLLTTRCLATYSNHISSEILLHRKPQNYQTVTLEKYCHSLYASFPTHSFSSSSALVSLSEVLTQYFNMTDGKNCHSTRYHGLL